MTTSRKARFTIAALLTLAAALPAGAQSAGEGFLFHAPDIRLGIRGGYARASAGSDLFDDVTKNLTLDRSDFSGLSVGANAGVALTERLELSLDAGFSRSSKGSEFRHLVDNNQLPIEQRTTFERMPLTANLKVYLTPPGQSIGSAAWIPAKYTPWVGAGGGAMRYRFLQQGDFVNFQNNAVFPDSFDSSGWTYVGQGMAGVDITLTPSVALTTEARYLRGHATLSSDFGGFNKIDLSGASASVGLSFRL